MKMIKELLLKVYNLIGAKPRERQRLLEQMSLYCVCAEIGVYKGSFAENILTQLKPKKLHLIDPWRYESGEVYKSAAYGGKAGSQEIMDAMYQGVREKFRHQIERGIIAIHRVISEEASKEFSDNYFDWVYIDANHQYEFAKRDLRLYYKKVKKDGFIAGDDYTQGHWWQGGVKKAVDEFLTKGLVRTISIKNGLFILQKI